MATTVSNKYRSVLAPLILLAIIIAVAAGSFWIVPTAKNVNWMLVGIVAAISLACILIGYCVTSLLRGLLVDSNNTISLSQLQLVMWTVLILGTYLTAVLVNRALGSGDPLNITVPPEIWILLGISGGSAAGSALIKSNKQNEPPPPSVKDYISLNKVKQPADDYNPVGVAAVRPSPRDASWTDMFRGEEVGDTSLLDIGKIQMFFFTIIVWLAYAVSVSKLLETAFASLPAEGSVIKELPLITTGMATLLGVSHAAYLAHKAVPHTPDRAPKSSAPATPSAQADTVQPDPAEIDPTKTDQNE